MGFPGDSVVKNPPAMQETRIQASLGQEDPWRRKWQPTPAFLPGNSHGQRRLAGYKLQSMGIAELDMSERPSNNNSSTEYIQSNHSTLPGLALW